MVKNEDTMKDKAKEFVIKYGGKYPTNYLGYELSEILKEINCSLDEFNLICDKFTNKNTIPNISYKRQGFLTNFIGFKYLFFDPFKKEKEINLYSWKANQFKIKDLIPAISLTLGTNFSSEAYFDLEKR